MLVDDHEVVRRGIVTVIDASPALTVIGEASSVAEATRRLPAIRPEVLVVDLQLPDGTGIDVMRAARELDPEQIGRASCRERGEMSVKYISIKKETIYTEWH